MSIAAPNAACFYREVAASRVVRAIRDSEGFPTPINGDKKRAMPFWSSESRAMEIIANVEDYRDFRTEPISWDVFAQRWIPGLMKDGILAGLNWSGPNATGYDVEPTDIERNVLAVLNQAVAQAIHSAGC
ncbi:DUF2750 domain-containing protein [Methylomonas sp. ZR1]|uniref:DUF2750 domain-containing protein n=1 Tax=Methylomonas sp. ZR1 TaxID=1797072 RepID=UPI001491B2AD|nr:DUF2750 domain-containing protein [Methylomonas sp. ZR1]NOV29564.1 DUF2750 domain-containing protein [Methylomonas sp. ZR1]